MAILVMGISWGLILPLEDPLVDIELRVSCEALKKETGEA